MDSPSSASDYVFRNSGMSLAFAGYTFLLATLQVNTHFAAMEGCDSYIYMIHFTCMAIFATGALIDFIIDIITFIQRCPCSIGNECVISREYVMFHDPESTENILGLRVTRAPCPPLCIMALRSWTIAIRLFSNVLIGYSASFLAILDHLYYKGCIYPVDVLDILMPTIVSLAAATALIRMAFTMNK